MGKESDSRSRNIELPLDYRDYPIGIRHNYCTPTATISLRDNFYFTSLRDSTARPASVQTLPDGCSISIEELSFDDNEHSVNCTAPGSHRRGFVRFHWEQATPKRREKCRKKPTPFPICYRKIVRSVAFPGKSADEEKGAANRTRVRRNKDIKRSTLPLDTPFGQAGDHFLSSHSKMPPGRGPSLRNRSPMMNRWNSSNRYVLVPLSVSLSFAANEVSMIPISCI